MKGRPNGVGIEVGFGTPADIETIIVIALRFEGETDHGWEQAIDQGNMVAVPDSCSPEPIAMMASPCPDFAAAVKRA